MLINFHVSSKILIIIGNSLKGKYTYTFKNVLHTHITQELESVETPVFYVNLFIYFKTSNLVCYKIDMPERWQVMI